MKNKAGNVYFIRVKGLEPVKIGATANEDIKERIKTFKTGAPFGIEILASIKTDDCFLLERELHNEYKTRRTQNEWFNLSTDEVKAIAEKYNNHNYSAVQNLKNYIEENSSLINKDNYRKIKAFIYLQINEGKEKTGYETMKSELEDEMVEKIINQCTIGENFFTIKDCVDLFGWDSTETKTVLDKNFKKIDKIKRYNPFNRIERMGVKTSVGRCYNYTKL